MATTKTRKPKALSKSNQQELRDALYVWLYVSISQFGTITAPKTNIPDLVDTIVDDLVTGGHLAQSTKANKNALTVKITSIVTSVRNRKKAYLKVAQEFNSVGPAFWGGDLSHPGFDELDVVLPKL